MSTAFAYKTLLQVDTVGGEWRRWDQRWPDSSVITIVSLEMTIPIRNRNGTRSKKRSQTMQAMAKNLYVIQHSRCLCVSSGSDNSAWTLAA